MLGGGGIAEQDSAVLGGGGIAEQEESAWLGGGGIAEQEDSAVLGGGGIAEPDSAVPGGGGIAEQEDSAVLGGGGITEPERALLNSILLIVRLRGQVGKSPIRPGVSSAGSDVSPGGRGNRQGQGTDDLWGRTCSAGRVSMCGMPPRWSGRAGILPRASTRASDRNSSSRRR